MSADQRQRKRAPRDELRTLLNEWDPAGRLAAGAPRDTYDVLLDELIGLLGRNRSAAEVTTFLQKSISERFATKARDADRFAAKAIAWHSLQSEEKP